MPKPKRSSANPAARLGNNRYGKSRIRMMKVTRDGKRHTVREFEFSITLSGDFEAVHTRGDNALCLPTDTMKNTVYALGKDHPIDTIESFAHHLALHFINENPHLTCASVNARELSWNRLTLRGREHPHTFARGSAEVQWCGISVVRENKSLEHLLTSGLQHLTLLKSADSGFSGFPRDRYTTLVETDDRILATSIDATWNFGSAHPQRADHAKARTSIRAAIIDTFARHKSKSVQHTLYAMGEAALAAAPAVTDIHLELPNKHCLLANLAPFGLTNNNEIFIPTDEPHGQICATLHRA